MKSEQIDKFVGKNVKVIFLDDTFEEGILGQDYLYFNGKWQVKGYYLVPHDNPYFTYRLENSNVKRIEEIP